jgi:eukaryotic-like serine/threonine-protein kinase
MTTPFQPQSHLQERLARGLDGRYRVESVLGEGGMAIVFLAHDARHDRRVALKVLRPDISAEVGAERFLREIKLAAGLTHPHILPVYDSGEVDGLLFYVMPNMAGNSLRARLDRERQLPLDESLRIAREVASALDYAHRNSVIHRDIKPENILLHEGNAMVADFGIGKALSRNKSITQTGMSVGTPAYMSPEQASGDIDVDGRSDLYSLGCVLYEMLTGEPPFTGPNAQAIIAKRFVAPIPHVKVTRDVPDAVDSTVTRALARTPADRYPSVAEFAERLRQLMSDGSPQQRTPESQRASTVRKAVAVLPFTNMSADPENEYFSDGMTEEIINAIGKVPGLQVASRSSSFAFKGRQVDLHEVGEKLGVGSIVEGSVRKIGNKIRITAQLVNVESGYHLWSENYNRQLEDVFAIQEEIARAIVDALKLRLASDSEQLVTPAKNLDAYNLYLKGRYFYHRAGEGALRKAIEFFQRVLLLEPGYARAYAGTADCYCRLADDWIAPDEGYPQARTMAQRALQSDPDLPEALSALAKVHAWYEWDFTGAEKLLRRAVGLAPNDAEIHWAFGSVLPAVGQLGEAIEELLKALELNPLDPLYARWVARFQLYAGDYAAAVAQGEKVIELDDKYVLGYVDIGSAWLALGEAEKALTWYQRGQRLEASARSYDVFIVRALAALDRREEAEAIMAKLEEESRQRYVRADHMAMGYAALGEADQAMQWLERAHQTHSAGLIYLHLDPGFAPLRSDRRFTALVERIGLM